MHAITKCKRAHFHGWSTMPFKWVSGLTKEEKNLVKKGGIVYRRIKAVHYRQSGFKVVVFRFGRWFHREPTGEQLIRILNFEKKGG